jgi:hypothetical protein
LAGRGATGRELAATALDRASDRRFLFREKARMRQAGVPHGDRNLRREEIAQRQIKLILRYPQSFIRFRLPVRYSSM